MSKNSIDKRIIDTEQPKTQHLIAYRKGGPVEDKPKPNNVLIPIKPNMLCMIGINPTRKNSTSRFDR